MPELPEVELTRANLARWTARKTIAAVRVVDRRIVGKGAQPETVTGKRIKGVERRGKRLRLVLAGGPDLHSHLGMTGKWVLRKQDDPQERFEKVRIDLVPGTKSLRYVDPRLLGRVTVADELPAAWRALGPDPLIDGLDAKALHERLGARKGSIKEVMMDQAIIAGIGNIQAQEALWRARIHPRKPAKKLSLVEVRRLVKAIDATIAHTLSLQGEGEDPAYIEDAGAENPFEIYGRHGEPCPRCKEPLVRIVQGGRSTVFCPRCQT